MWTIKSTTHTQTHIQTEGFCCLQKRESLHKKNFLFFLFICTGLFIKMRTKNEEKKNRNTKMEKSIKNLLKKCEQRITISLITYLFKWSHATINP